MKIRFRDIPEGGIHYDITDNSWIPEELASQHITVSARISMKQQSESRIELTGELETRVNLVCDRCLGEFVWPVSTHWQLILEHAESRHWHLHDVELSDSDIEIVSLPEPVVDLHALLREQLYLTLPEKKICQEDCKGLCNECGIDLNLRTCQCKLKKKGGPFDVLAGMKTKK